MIKKIFLIILLAGNLNLLYAQRITSFSTDSIAFLDELTDFMKSGKGDEGESLAMQFVEMWRSGNFKDEQKQIFKETANKLLERRAQPFPYFALYIKATISFIENSKDLQSYKQWQNAFTALLSKKHKSLSDIEVFLNFSNAFLSDFVLFSNRSISWRATPTTFRFEYTDSLKIHVGKTDLTCFASKDSMMIYQTEGVFYPEKFLWQGKNGRVTWERLGFSKDSVFTDLKNYTINMSRTSYEADSVKFTNYNFYPKPLLGTFKEKVIHSKNPQNVPFPQFESYKTLNIKNIQPSIDYQGGYSMHGIRLIGQSADGTPAKLRIHKNDTTLMTAQSVSFGFNKNIIMAYNTAINIKIDEDSISHPNLLFKYFIDKRKIVLIRNKKDISQTLYSDSYHKYNIDVELLMWNIDSTRIYMKNLLGSARNKLELESENYFSMSDYLRYQYLDEKNPISAIQGYSMRRDSVLEFYGEDLAKEMRRNFNYLNQTLIKLSYDGFIDYDQKTHLIRIKPKLIHFINARRSILTKEYHRNSDFTYDYDIIQISSETDRSVPNCVLDLKTKELELSGVDSVIVSRKVEVDTVMVYNELMKRERRIPVIITPSTGKMSIKKNRDFSWDGKFQLGYFRFHGSDFYFDYDSFRVDLKQVDSLKVSLPEVDSTGQKTGKITDVKNKIEDVVGFVFLDQANNKSGNEYTPEYPKFSSTDTSFVNYGDSTIQDVTYPDDEFNFRVDPYDVESIYSFTTNNWVLDGTFKSGGIVPEIREQLRIIKDTVDKFNGAEASGFGFNREIDTAGIPVYGNRGMLFNTLRLGLRGLRGQGELQYLTSRTKAPDFIFFLDSMNVDASEFVIAQQKTPVEYPTVKNTDLYIHWKPYEDQMFAHSKENPFDMYYKEQLVSTPIHMNGVLNLTPHGLEGDGKTSLESAKITSHKFDYKGTYFDADTADYTLYALVGDDSTFHIKNVETHMNLAEKKGILKANSENCFAMLPQNEYYAYMQDYKWFMDKRKMEMRSAAKPVFSSADTIGLTEIQKEDLMLEGSKMVSTNPRQDSLSFKTTFAEYDMENSIITANPVKLIRVADATTYPSTPVIIDKNAQMRTLKNAKIIASNENRLHTISEATVNIVGKLDYYGSGTYQYVNETKMPQSIWFESIVVNNKGRTTAEGEIKNEANFMLSNNFTFEGRAKLDAGFKYMLFSGYTQMVHECEEIAPEKFKFEARINPQDVYIPVKDSVFSINNDKLFAGMYLTKARPVLYASFFNKKKFYSDKKILGASGFLYFDKDEKTYLISGKAKIKDRNQPGNFLSLKKDFCSLSGEGKMDFGVDLGFVKIEPYGFVEHEVKSSKTEIDALVTLDFFFSGKAIDMMIDLLLDTKTLNGINLKFEKTQKKLNEAIGTRETKRIILKIEKRGEYQVPKKLEHTFTFSNLKFNWNPETRSYQSFGKIGIMAIENEPINKFVEGFVEIIKKQTGDKLEFYFKIDKKTWFFFSYDHSEGQMLSISSVQDYNDILIETKDKHRKHKDANKRNPYEFNIAEKTIKNRFLRRFLSEDEMLDYDSNETIKFDDKITPPEDAIDPLDENLDDENLDDENSEDEQKEKDDKTQEDENKDLFDDDDDGEG